MGVLVSWNLGVSPSWALQLYWSGCLLLFQHVSRSLALHAWGQAEQPLLG